MAAETTRDFEALEAQAQTLMSVFLKTGYDAVAPAVIQPADVFLDVIGASLRARTYVFTDPDGAELCLRPDLTVPTCRLHLARHADGATPARYCYSGSAFRYQPDTADAAHPREFRQAGIERFTLRIGDLGLFNALLDALSMPERWRRRLKHHFWRREAFRDELT